MDSMAKMRPGFMSGEYTDYGKYDQCLDVAYNKKGTKFVGKYCLYAMNWPLPENDDEIEELKAALNETWMEGFSNDIALFRMVPITNSLCFPSVCSKDEIQTAVQFCKLYFRL